MAKISEYTIVGPPVTETSPPPHLHKSMTIRRDGKGESPNLRSLYRTSADMASSPDPEQSRNLANGVPTTTNLPPTPPAATSENADPAVDESSSDAALFRSTLVTPINQNSPPTPDNTPPRDRNLPFRLPFLETQPSMASTRADSFKTAQEELQSDDGWESLELGIDDPTPRARKSPGRLTNGVYRMQTSALTRSPLSSEAALQSPALEQTKLETPSGVMENQVVFNAHKPGEEGLDADQSYPPNEAEINIPSSPPGFTTPQRRLPREHQDHVKQEMPSLTQSAPVTKNEAENVKRGPSLRDRLREAQRDSPSASTEKFASIIGWTTSVSSLNQPEERRVSGNSNSTIGAFVIDTSPLPRRRTTLRHVTKNDSLRSASSPLPATSSNRTSLNSNSDSPHRLVHKKARLSNQNRWSFGSEVSRSYSVSSSAVLPKTEIIRVAVIPERSSSLQSSANSSKRHSISTTSGQGNSRKASDNLPPSSWQRKRTMSESQSQDRGRQKPSNVLIPPRSSSLSAPTSRSTSRANSITSEHLRVRRQEAETDLRKTLDKMESERLVITLRGLHGQEGDGPNAIVESNTVASSRSSRMPRQSIPDGQGATGLQLPIVPGSQEWAALRPASILETPFSQPSFRSASPELNEARAVNLFPHNNHSLQLIEPNLMQESRAVQAVRKQYMSRDEVYAESPLRNPRRPPEPPIFVVQPPGSADELERHLSLPGRKRSQRRPPARQQSESFMKAITRNLSLKNAKNKKAGQDLDGNLHPLWRPRPFWDDVDGQAPLPPSTTAGRDSQERGIVNNSLGLPQERTVITGPVSLVRRISERRRRNRALVKQSSQGSLARLRASHQLYRSPILGLNLRFMGIHDIQDRLLYARQRKEDERRERRRAALRESIGANVISQGDSRFPAGDSSLASKAIESRNGSVAALESKTVTVDSQLDCASAGEQVGRLGPPISRTVSTPSITLTCPHPPKLASSSPQERKAVTGPGSGGSPLQGHKRNVSLAGFDSSPGASESPDQHGDDTQGKRRPVKRACNECRQQKLRCNVVQEPFQICSRCSRLNLECKIEDNFKRIGKRSRNAEMEREIVELRKQVAQQSGMLQGNGIPNGTATLATPQSTFAHDAATGLLDLRSGYDKSPGRGPIFKRLEDVALTHERIQDLHKRYFTFHHSFLPFLNPNRTPEEYYQRSPLLFWTIVTTGARHYHQESQLYSNLIGPLTRLMWSTMAEVPQNYHVVKALILLCAWPLPTSSTSTDPTFMLCGLMMQIALQIGLHRSNHAQDFTKFRIELREVELQDRVVVWSVCNLVAQRVCTSYGQPPMTIYDWTLGPKPIENNPSYELPSPILNRLLIEKFVDKVSRTLYMNPQDPVGLASDHERPTYVSFLAKELEELEDHLRQDHTPITRIYLRAAVLHMRLSAFFSPPSLPTYRADMLKLYNATTEYLEACLSLENESSVSLASTYTHGLSLTHATNYIFHMMLAAGFSLLKLMHNFLGQHELDTNGASELLTRTLWALRSMSVVENDLAERLAEVLAQVWKSGRVRAEPSHSIGEGGVDDSLQLRVKCRMSMSLVFDSVWRWRKNFGFKSGKPSEVRAQNIALQAETRPQSRTGMVDTPSNNNGNNNGNSIMSDPSLGSAMVPGMAGMSTGMVDDFGMDYGQANYEVFDPLNWMLDGIVEFPYNFNPAGQLDLGSGM